MASAQLDSEDLSPLAIIARRALGCTGVLVTGRRSRESTTVVGIAGIDLELVREQWPVVVRIDQPPYAPLPGGGGLPFVAETATAPLGDGHEIHAFALFASGRRLGGFHVVNPIGRAFDRGLARSFARHAAVAIARRRLRRGSSAHLERRMARADAILDFAAAVSSVGFESLVSRIEQAATTVLGRVRTRVYLYNEDREMLEPLQGPGHSGAGAPARPVDPRDMRIGVSRVFALGRPYLTNGPFLEDRADSPTTWNPVPSSLLSLPLFVSGRASGILQIADKPRGFTISDVHDAELVARPIAVAVELTATLRRLRLQNEIEAVLADAASQMRTAEELDAVVPDVIAAMRRATSAQVLALAPERGPIVSAHAEGATVAHDEFVRWLQEPDGVGPDQPETHDAEHEPPSVMPVLIGEQRIAVLAARPAPGTAFGSPERRGLARLANVIALTLAGARDVAQRTALARLEERQVMADELHDEVAQLLFAAQIQLDELIEQPAMPEGAVDRAVLANSLLIRSDATLRRVITELPHRSGQLLSERVEGVAEETRRAFRAEIRTVIAPDVAAVATAGSADAHDTLVGAARESLTNAAKHAGPCTIDLSLDVVGADTLRLRVVDDGVGLAEAPGETTSHGLPALWRRVEALGGRIDVTPRATGGTAVVVELPVGVAVD